MGKVQLCNAVADTNENWNSNDVSTVLDKTIDIIKDTLVAGDSVSLAGFGTFSTRYRAATETINPRTGISGPRLTMFVRKVVSFKAGKVLKEAVNRRRRGLLNKGELFNEISNQLELTDRNQKVRVANIVNAILDTIANKLADGEAINIVGFGRFFVEERAARTGRNPRTGEEIQIAAAKAVKFTPGQRLKDAVNRRRLIKEASVRGFA